MEERERERERERESKKHAKTDYIARLWQLLPQWLKNIPRAVRSQWHGDFYDEIARRDDLFQQQLAEQAMALKQLGERLEKTSALFRSEIQQLPLVTQEQWRALQQLSEQSVAKINSMAEWQTAALCNQISLANKTPGRRTLYMPWFVKKSFHLDMSAEGQPCFSASNGPPTRQRKILVQTIPKSGTYFVGAILEALSFKNIGIHSASHLYDDVRKFEANNKWAVINGGEQTTSYFDRQVPLPFSVHWNLLQPNQYMVGHLVGSKDFVLDLRLHDEDRLLMVIRDLRQCVVSHMRHQTRTSVQYRPVSSYTDEDVCAYLHNASSGREFLFNMARCCLNLIREPYLHLVRHEELMATDHAKMRPSAEAISRATGCQTDEVMNAIEMARGTKTRTYSGSPSILDSIWTERVEELFVKLGGDVLNEQLDYPREYIPKN